MTVMQARLTERFFRDYSLVCCYNKVTNDLAVIWFCQLSAIDVTQPSLCFYWYSFKSFGHDEVYCQCLSDKAKQHVKMCTNLKRGQFVDRVYETRVEKEPVYDISRGSHLQICKQNRNQLSYWLYFAS